MVIPRLDPLVCTRRRAALAALLAAAFWLAAAASPRAAEMGAFFRIGTGDEAGSAFVVGEVLADSLQAAFSAESCGLPDCSNAPVLAAAQLSGGSLANVADLAAGRVEAALVAAPVVRWAQRGEEPYEAAGPVGPLRAVARLYPVLLQVVTLARSGIHEIGDLRGRRVSLDGEGSATRPIARRVLAAYGLGEDDIEARDLEPGIALERLAAGRLDAFFALGGVPLEAVSRLEEIAEIRLLPVSAGRLAEDETLAATIGPATVPAGAYAGLPAVDTVATAVELLVAEDLDEALVYALTASLWAPETRQRLQAVQPLTEWFAPEAATEGLEVPLHPGAERYYRERGLLP